MPLTERMSDLDDGVLWSDFQTVVSHDTATAVGEQFMDPADPRIASFMREVGVPLLRRCGATTTVDRLNNVIGTFGPLTGRELLFVAYPVNHHGNLMEHPLQATRFELRGEEQWSGLGASQGKGGLVALIAALDVA